MLPRLAYSLSNIPRVLNECPAVGLETGDGAANVFVDLNNLLHGACLKKRARHSLLHAEDHTLAGLDADGCAAELDGLEGVFDLEETAFRREGANELLDVRRRSVVAGGTYLIPRSVRIYISKSSKDIST